MIIALKCSAKMVWSSLTKVFLGKLPQNGNLVPSQPFSKMEDASVAATPLCSSQSLKVKMLKVLDVFHQVNLPQGRGEMRKGMSVTYILKLILPSPTMINSRTI